MFNDIDGKGRPGEGEKIGEEGEIGCAKGKN